MAEGQSDDQEALTESRTAHLDLLQQLIRACMNHDVAVCQAVSRWYQRGIDGNAAVGTSLRPKCSMRTIVRLSDALRSVDGIAALDTTLGSNSRIDTIVRAPVGTRVVSIEWPQLILA